MGAACTGSVKSTQEPTVAAQKGEAKATVAAQKGEAKVSVVER